MHCTSLVIELQMPFWIIPSKKEGIWWILYRTSLAIPTTVFTGKYFTTKHAMFLNARLRGCVLCLFYDGWKTCFFCEEPELQMFDHILLGTSALEVPHFSRDQLWHWASWVGKCWRSYAFRLHQNTESGCLVFLLLIPFLRYTSFAKLDTSFVQTRQHLFPIINPFMIVGRFPIMSEFLFRGVRIIVFAYGGLVFFVHWNVHASHETRQG